MRNTKNIIVIGLGGVGGYFGFKINKNNENNKSHRVTFVARGKTFETVKNTGLTLLSPDHESATTVPDSLLQNISEITHPDLIFICVKEYDLENVCTQLSEVITPNTILFPMMNGANIYDRIRTKLPNNIILPSCVYVASHIKEKGIVEHTGKAGKLIFGKDPENPASDITWVTQIIKQSAIDFEFKENSMVDIWTKFIFIASFGLVTAKHNSSIGKVCSDEFQRKEATEIMTEIHQIAKGKSIRLGDHIINISFSKASTFPPKTPTSLQLDVNNGKEQNELELFAGAILKYGSDLKIKTPFTQNIYNEIKAINQG